MTAPILIVVIFIGSCIATALVGEESVGQARSLARRLVRAAAKILPRDQRERWTEEMLADLASFDDRPLTMLSHGLYAFASAGALRRASAAKHSVTKSLTMSYVIQAPAAAATASALTPTARATEVFCGTCRRKLDERPDEAERRPCPACRSTTREIHAYAFDSALMMERGHVTRS